MRFLTWTCVVGLLFTAIVSAQPVDFSHGPLRVSDNQRYLVHEDGTPFFYLGDTAWELFHRLNREEANRYLENRAAKGYTVIQAVALAEIDGLNVPNPYGFRPLEENDPTRPLVLPGPNNDYWDHVDYIVNRAEDLGMYIGMLPTWGDKWNRKWGVGPVVFTPQNAQVYGRWLGKRYRNKPIIWIVGGDRPIENDTHKQIIRAMARGLKQGDQGRHLMTFHPTGGRTSSEWFHNDTWLDFNMHQTGHKDRGSWDRIHKDYQRSPTKPVIDGEPLYEDHPINFNPMKFGFSADWHVRRLAYWHVFAGACGHTYGCHNIWQMYAPGRSPVSWAHRYWYESLDLWGAADMTHVRSLMLSRPFVTRVPDQSLIASDVGKGDGRLSATRNQDGSYAFVYVPLGTPVKVHLHKLSGKSIRAWWFDPRHGTAQEIGTYPRKGSKEFKPPVKGKGNDWVLVLDDADQDYPAPGVTYEVRITGAQGSDKQRNEFSVQGDQVLLNGKPFKVIGLRCSNALISEKDTLELIGQLDTFKAYGVNTVSVFFMGSRFGDVKGYLPDASLNPMYSTRMARIIEAANNRDMVVLVGCLYWSTSQAKADLGHWTQDHANRAVANTVRWLKQQGYRNVLVDPDNEGMAARAQNWSIASMIDAAHAVDPSYMIGYNKKSSPPANADVLLHHSPQDAQRPYIESEGTPTNAPQGYWGKYSKEDGYYNYIRIGRYTAPMKQNQIERTQNFVDNRAGYIFASTWIQCVSHEGINGPYMLPGGQAENPDIDKDVKIMQSDAGIRWWLEWIRSQYGPWEP